MNKFSFAVLICLFLNCSLIPAIDENGIYFQGKPTNYQKSDFQMWTDDVENYALTANEWLGIYGNNTQTSIWYRVIPDGK